MSDQYLERGVDDAESVQVGALQMAGGDVASADYVKQQAAHGLQGQGSALPHFETIQQAFGPQHDLSNVTAHVGGAAAKANRAMNAKAYATGNAIAFRDQPDLKLAAHEAAHVVQQRAGVSLSDGVGKQGDVYEKHADMVADRVASGRSASDLLPAASSGSAGVQQAVQKYEEVGDWRAAESFEVAVKQESGAGGQTLLATKGQIDKANQELAKAGTKGSFIRLEEDGTNWTAGSNKLVGVKPVFHDPEGDGEIYAKETALANQKGNPDATGDASDKFALYSDCGRSSRVVMGSRNQAPKATIKIGGEEMETSRAYNPQQWTDGVYLEGMKAFVCEENKAHLKKDVHYKDGGSSGGSRGNPFLNRGGIKYIQPKSGKEAKQMWGALDDEGKKAFAKELGINEFANPDVGGGYTMATGGDLPGFKKMGDMTWNFHWAGVIMKAGDNNITLENYAIMFEPTGDPEVDKKNRERAFNWTNKDWVYQMYGTKKEGQTFHEQHLATGTHGSEGTSFAVGI